MDFSLDIMNNTNVTKLSYCTIDKLWKKKERRKNEKQCGHPNTPVGLKVRQGDTYALNLLILGLILVNGLRLNLRTLITIISNLKK